MQGTAAIVLAAAFSAVRAAGSRMRDQRVVIYGAGTAGLGIADMMRDQMIREGLSPRGGDPPVLPAGPATGCWSTTAADLLDFQQPYARPRDEVDELGGAGRPAVGLAEVVAPGAPDDADRHLHPVRRVHRGRS